MSARTLIVLILAIVCGGSSAAGVFLLRSRVDNAVSDTIPVIVATSEIARGEVVSSSNIASRDWPRNLAPTNAVSDSQSVLDRTALTLILPGEPILSGKLAEAGAGRGLAALIPDGRRAYTIHTARVASNVAGFVMPGNRVDVLLTLRGGGPDDSTGGGSSTTLLQAVEILAVDRRLDGQSESRVEPQQLRSVTLLVTPDQASLLDLGQNMGTLALSLRNPGDLAESDTVPATVNTLRFTQREPVPDINAAGSPTFLNRSLGYLAAAVAAVPKAAMMSSLAARADPDSRPEFAEVQTLRGRHSGRILVREHR